MAVGEVFANHGAFYSGKFLVDRTSVRGRPISRGHFTSRGFPRQHNYKAKHRLSLRSEAARKVRASILVPFSQGCPAVLAAEVQISIQAQVDSVRGSLAARLVAEHQEE